MVGFCRLRVTQNADYVTFPDANEAVRLPNLGNRDYRFHQRTRGATMARFSWRQIAPLRVELLERGRALAAAAELMDPSNDP